MPRILVVDDSDVDRRLVGGLLRNAGHDDWQVEFAEDGAEAIEKIDEDSFDMIITDLVMPRLGGFELVQAVKERHAQTPVILITSKGNEDVALKALQLGAASYTPKKRLSRALVATVEDILSVSGEREAGTLVDRFLQETTYRFSFGNDFEVAMPMVRFLQKEAVKVARIDEAERVRFGIALKEALTNAIVRGNLELEFADSKRLNDVDFQAEIAQRSSKPPYADRQIQLEARIGSKEVTIVIRDEGPGFEVAALAGSVADLIEKRTGRGYVVIRSFMDNVQFNDAGNEITMTKSWTSNQADKK
ncbi:MAG: response regulator [bacterium]|nr:response regulator [bacterium]